MRGAKTGYDWGGSTQQEQPDLDSTVILPTPEGVVYGKKGKQRVRGRGCVNALTKHPLVYLDPIRAWFSSFAWKTRDPENTCTPTSFVTFLEAVVDF